VKPEDVLMDLDVLVSHAAERGFRPEVLNIGPMGSYQVLFVGPLNFTVTCDRGQLSLEGERPQLESHGLWRVFDDRRAFADAVIAWIPPRP